jgi:Zn-dependent protease with chaperone function
VTPAMTASEVGSVASATLLDPTLQNRRRTRRVLASIALVVAVVVAAVLGFAAGWLIGIPLGLLAGAAAVWAAWHDLERTVLGPLGARPADPDDRRTGEARLCNVVDGLCLAAGVPMPAVLVLDDPRPNALALGRDPRRASLVVTSGLLDALDRVELEAVVAHELSHVRSLDTLPATLAVRLGRLPAVGTTLRNALDDDGREVLADLNGVAMTRFPPGLVAALAKLGAAEPPGPAASRHLWLATSDTDLQGRAAALREL